MTRRCERPGCAEVASVAFRFDARRRLVELFPGLSEFDSQAGALCRRHGDAMVLPRGWVLDDQRDLTPRLFRVAVDPTPPPPLAAADEPSEPVRPRRRRRSPAAIAGDGGADVNLFVVPETTVAQVAGAHPDAEPDETQAIPWAPTFDKGDTLGGMLDATTPLLRRAFGGDRRDQPR
jgi:hypothetical protein